MKKRKNQFNRFVSLCLIMIIIFVSIVSRLVFLQIVKADEYKDKANTKAISELQEYAPRGKILANDGVTQLATNVQSYNVTFTVTDESNKNFLILWILYLKY